jgi:ABC-type transport system involved in multi-copper enzyme maturation permease subunit
MLPDPTMSKELSGFARRPLTYIGRGLYVGLVGLIVYQFWQFNAKQVLLSPSAYARLGRDLFNQFFWMNLGLVTIASILAGADLVNREVRAGTLGILSLTPLSALQIARGKWKAAFLQTASLVLCGLPVVGICLYLGGVGYEEVAWSFALTLSSAALGAAFAVRASALHPTNLGAIGMAALSYVGFLIVPFLFVIPGGIALASYLHPVYAAVGLAMSREPRLGLQGLEHGWIGATAVSFIVARFLIGRAAQAVAEKAVADPAAPDLSVGFGSGEALLHRMTVKRGFAGARVWEEQPLLWKELATRAGQRSFVSLWGPVFVLVYGVFAYISWFATFGKSLEVLHSAGSVFLLLAMISGSSLFAREKERRSWEVLLSTPLSAWEIVRAKLLSGILSTEPLAAALIYVLTIVAFSWWSGPLGMLVVGTTLLLFCLFAYVLGAAASLHSKSLRGAFFGVSGVVLVLLLFVPFAFEVLRFGSKAFDTALEAAVRTTHPVALLQPLTPRDEAFTLTMSGGGLREVLGSFLMYVCVYGIALLGLVVHMVRSFDRITGRTS